MELIKKLIKKFMEPKSEIEVKTIIEGDVTEVNGANLSEVAQNQDNLREVTYKRMPQINEVKKDSHGVVAEDTVRVINGIGDFVREYSFAVHGENYKTLAQQYSTKTGFKILEPKS